MAIRNATLITCLIAYVASTQNAPPAFRSNVELVTVPCTVVNANGVAVEGLTRDEFQVYDNGVRRVIENFWIDTDLPLTLGILIDASASQEQQLTEHRLTALALLRQILRPGDRAFVISIAEDVRLWLDLTGMNADIGRQMSEGLGNLFGQPCGKRSSAVTGLKPMSMCGSSPLWNALHDAAKIKMHSLTGSKALLILTDGFDSGSTYTWRQAVDEAARAENAVYAIQYPSAFGKNYAPDLYRVVEETGGTWFRPPGNEHQPIVSRIEADLRRRYVLGFRPDRLSGKVRHEVRVEVARPGLTVRARKTYFHE